jgi:hypothetical protein
MAPAPVAAALPEAAPDSVAAAPSLPATRARSADEFINTIGANVHLGYFRGPYGTLWAKTIKPKILGLGIRHLRDGGTVVADDEWMRIVYGRMKELLPGQVKFSLVMAPPAGSANFTSMAHFNRLLTYALPVVESFEGLNEHDLSGRPHWVDEARAFQRSLYAAVKNDSRTRNMPVLGPAMGNPAHAAAVGDLTHYLNYGSIHPYPGGRPSLEALLDHQLKTKPVSGSKRLVATESGYHTAAAWTGGHPAVSEQAMARYTLRLLLNYFNAGIPRTWLYELIDQGTDPLEREDHFGLLRANGSEKPAYTALANLIGVLKDPGPTFTPSSLSFELSGDLTAIESTLLEKRDGRFYLILWQEVSSFDLAAKRDLSPSAKRVTLALSTPATFRVFTPVLSPSVTQQVQGTSLQVEVADHPIVVEIVRP